MAGAASALPTGGRGALALGLAATWAVRLSALVLWRRRGRGEDARYAAWRERWRAAGQPVALRGLVQVFWLQGALASVLALPVLVALRSDDAPGAAAVVGAALALGGIAVEAVADLQLERHRRRAPGTLCTGGLRRHVRHPSYTGEIAVWWGLALVAVGAPDGAVGLLGAVLATVLLIGVSGARHLDRHLQGRPGYAEYRARTGALLPRLRRG